MQETFSFYKIEERPAVETWPRAGMSPEWLRVPSLKEIDDSLIKYNECCAAVDASREYCATIKGFCSYAVKLELPDNATMNKIYLQEALKKFGMFNLPLTCPELGRICNPFSEYKDDMAPITDGGTIEFVNDEPYIRPEPSAGEYAPKEDRRITARDVREIAGQLCKCERGIIARYVRKTMMYFFKERNENRPIRSREHYGFTYLSTPSRYDSARNAKTVFEFLRYFTRGETMGWEDSLNVAGIMDNGGEWKNEFFTAQPQKNGAANLSLSAEAVRILENMRLEYYGK